MTRPNSRWKVVASTRRDDHLKPYGWYRDLVIEGAREHELPQDYIAGRIDAVEAIEDPDLARDAKERVVLNRKPSERRTYPTTTSREVPIQIDDGFRGRRRAG